MRQNRSAICAMTINADPVSAALRLQYEGYSGARSQRGGPCPHQGRRRDQGDRRSHRVDSVWCANSFGQRGNVFRLRDISLELPIQQNV